MIPSQEQQQIIDAEGSIVVIARPGSGKTFVLAKKIQKILLTLDEYQGVIAISYTRKASKELKDRSLKGGIDKKSSFFGTIHSFYISEIVLSFGKQVFGLPTQEIEIVEPSNNDEKNYIEHLEKDFDSKNTEHIKALKDMFLLGRVYLRLIEKYAIYILNNSSACTNYLKARYKYIIIDEFQDCGKEQSSIFLGLKNYLGLTAIAVGDLDQSIFEFSGKSAIYLKELQENTTFQEFSLLKNYRCHPSITNYSLALMDKNAQLIETTSIRVLQKEIEGDERDIGKWIDRCVVKICNTPLSKIAILTRSSRTAEIIYDAMSSPCRIILNSSLENSSHLIATLFDKIIKFAYNKQITITEIIEDSIYSDTLTEIEKKELKINFERIRDILNRSDFDINQTKILFGQIAKILIPNANQESSLNLLEKVLSEELEIYSKVSEDEVQIITLHKSKGLEFDIVFHLDLYEHIFPQYNGNYNQDLNLHYVGVTRAKKACILCTSTKRTKANGDIVNANISEFLTLNNVQDLRKNY